jgi:mannose-6-phosphate isomerase class I
VMASYEPNPCFPVAGGPVAIGWRDPVSQLGLRSSGPLVLALDGPAVLDWHDVVDDLCAEIRRVGSAAVCVDIRTRYTRWEEVVHRTSSAGLADDADFDRLAEGGLADLFDDLPTLDRPAAGVLVVFGPAAALVEHDVLWYADVPKRYAEAQVVAGTGRNLGQQEGHGTPTTKRLFYVDWPLLDRHRDALCPVVDRWFDVQDPSRPTSLDGTSLQQTLSGLARRPIRTLPTFNTSPWGGHWAQRRLGVNASARNTALGYELIAPESGVLCGDQRAQVELPFQMVVASHPAELLGQPVHERFGTSFPIRFDYLDTVDGGNLSVHCHPRRDYMSRVFGWPYPQHETYYVMVGGEDARVFLGLREDVDVHAFRGDVERAEREHAPFDIQSHVQTFAATPHQLFCVPAGSPHGSGSGNVVLEVSATPYLYSLRFYDWLRRDVTQRQRPVHIRHAFANLDVRRTGVAVGRDLVQRPRTLRSGEGWREELLGSLPEMFFEVRRLVIGGDRPLEDDSRDGFHVLNVVEGDGVTIEWDDVGRQDPQRLQLNYAETLVLPAAVGRYRVRRVGDGRVRVVKALVADASVA